MEAVGASAPYESRRVPITDPSSVGQARRVAATLARELTLSEASAGRLALVVTEAASNIVTHAGEGEILLRGYVEAEQRGIELLALDRGPGISDINRCQRDGYSTAGTAGEGLGSIERVADLYELYSQPLQGTALLARVEDKPPARVGARRSVGAVCVAKAGEEVVGDGFAVGHSPEGLALLIVDGLGHGPDAATAARAAISVFAAEPFRAPLSQLGEIHEALRTTRGAVASVVLFARGLGELQYAGVGNCGAYVVAPERTHGLANVHGTLGAQVRSFRAYDESFPEGARLVLHSDGLLSRWSLEAYPGLTTRHPSLIAGILYRDYCRGRDDVTVVVV